MNKAFILMILAILCEADPAIAGDTPREKWQDKEYLCRIDHQVAILPNFVGEIKNTDTTSFRAKISTRLTNEELSRIGKLPACNLTRQNPRFDIFSPFDRSACATYTAELFFDPVDPVHMFGGYPNRFEGLSIADGPIQATLFISIGGDFFYHESKYGSVLSMVGKCEVVS